MAKVRSLRFAAAEFLASLHCPELEGLGSRVEGSGTLPGHVEHFSPRRNSAGSGDKTSSRKSSNYNRLNPLLDETISFTSPILHAWSKGVCGL